MCSTVIQPGIVVQYISEDQGVYYSLDLFMSVALC